MSIVFDLELTNQLSLLIILGHTTRFWVKLNGI